MANITTAAWTWSWLPDKKSAPSNISPIPASRASCGWPVLRREDLDGIKVYVGEVGWVMVRASGTEHMLRVYSETSRPETTERLLSEVTSLVRGL